MHNPLFCFPTPKPEQGLEFNHPGNGLDESYMWRDKPYEERMKIIQTYVRLFFRRMK